MGHIYNSTGHKTMLAGIVDSDGVFLIDGDGRRYMDLESGVWCASLGHNHPRVVEAIRGQLDTVMHAGFCYSAPIVEDAAALLLEVTGLNGGRSVFLSSGSEAIELARQTSKQLTGRRRSMTLHDSYLGSYSSTIDRAQDWHIFDWSRCLDCAAATEEGAVCEEILRIPEDVSEFVFEPGSSSGFVRFPPRTLIRNIVSAVKGMGAKLVVNEVTTGVGRTGKWFGYQHYGVKPDIIAVGKGIGSGFPVSATVFSPSTAADLEATSFHYMQSHQNDPLGAAVVHEVLRTIIDSDLISSAAEKGQVFGDLLRSLVDGNTVIGMRGRGLMFALEFRDRAICDLVYKELLDRGYIVGNRGSMFRIDPPLIITTDEFGRFADDLNTILTQQHDDR